MIAILLFNIVNFAIFVLYFLQFYFADNFCKGFYIITV